MNELLLALLIALGTPVVDDNVKPEDIHAGAVFQVRDGSTQIILIETWNKKFLMGWSWGQKYKLYSTWADKGGANVQEVVAYLRGSNYRYVGAEGSSSEKPRDSNNELAATVSNLTARVEALERRPQIERGPPRQPPTYTPAPIPQYQWPTGITFGASYVTNLPCAAPIWRSVKPTSWQGTNYVLTPANEITVTP
jgi:hypothetical protein